MQLIYAIKIHVESTGLIHIKLGHTRNIRQRLSQYSCNSCKKPEVIASWSTGETSVEKCERGVLNISKKYSVDWAKENRQMTPELLKEFISDIDNILNRVPYPEIKHIKESKGIKPTVEMFIDRLNLLGFQIIEDQNKKNNRWTVRKNDKLSFYLHVLKYGIAYQTYKNGKWHTDKIKTIDEMNKKLQEIELKFNDRN
jgi:hypothetical protein